MTKYYLVNSTIYDGEYEYGDRTVVFAENEQQAINSVEEHCKEWTENDYREYSISTPIPLTKEQYKTLQEVV